MKASYKASYFLCLVLFSILMMQCSNKKSVKGMETLPDVFLTDIDVVKDFLALPETAKNKKAAGQYFLKGVDLYRNKKQLEKSIAMFRKSLMTYPQAKGYYELGNVYADLKDYPMAIVFYEMARDLEYNPVSKLYYNMACCYSKKHDTQNALTYLSMALDEGYSNGKQVQTDPDLEYIRKEEKFQALVASFFSEGEERSGKLFSLFSASFPELDLPLEINQQMFDKLRNQSSKYISYDYAEFVKGMEDSRFSRDVTNDYVFVGRVSLSDSAVSLIYATIESMADTLAPVHLHLVNYAPSGKIIDAKKIACYCDPMHISTASIAENKMITISRYAQTWEKDPLKNGYQDNVVKEQKLIDTDQLIADTTGVFIENEPVLSSSEN